VPILPPAASRLWRERLLEVDAASMENLHCLLDDQDRLLTAVAGGIATIRSKVVMGKRD
jgi:hypothetical protein